MTISGSIHYATQIDISDITSDTDDDIGLYSGFLRWVTERPDYDGSTVVPTGEMDLGATKWKPGILTNRKELGHANRLINILASGDYGTLSGFSFNVDNTSVDNSGTGDKLSDVLEDNDRFLINRKMKHYVVINDVFYSAWSGIVANLTFPKLKMNITCRDDSITIHKSLPPNTVSKRLFSSLSSKAEGKSIPVCFGYVDNAKLLNISVQNDAINLLSKDLLNWKTAPIKSYDGDKTIEIYVGELVAATNDMQNLYLRHIVDGDDQVVRIVSNANAGYDITYGSYYTEIILENELTMEPVLYPTASDIKGSWVEVFDFKSVYIVSNDEINQFFRGESNTPSKLKQWDTDSLEWIDVSEIIEENSLTDIDSSTFPGLKVLSKVVDFDGNYIKLSTFAPRLVKYQGVLTSDNALTFAEVSNDFSIGGDNEDVRDYDQTTDGEIVVDVTNPSGSVLDSAIQYEFLCIPPEDLKISEYTNIYFLVDWDLESDKNLPNNNTQSITSGVKDSLNQNKEDISSSASFVIGGLAAGVPSEIRTIPGSHYNNGEGTQEQFENQKDFMSNVNFYSSGKLFRSFPNARFFVRNFPKEFPAGLTTRISTKIYEMCFAIEKEVNVITQDMYTKVDGELINGQSTRTITNTIKTILETYDGIDPDEIDWGNVIAARSNWKCGRQVLERKSSKEYLQEIARQSFIGIFPTRKGFRGLKAFRSDTDFSSVVHASDNGTIVAGSISKYEDSDINQVYNDFEIKYDHNPVNDSYEQIVFIHNADQGSFPDRFTSTAPLGSDVLRSFLTGTVTIKADGTTIITLTFASDPSWASVGTYISIDDTATGPIEFGKIIRKTTSEIDVEFNNTSGYSDSDTVNVVLLWQQANGFPAWKEYAGGYTDYNKGSSLWTACHNSYVRTGRLNSLPDSLGKCKWYIEESKFYPNAPGDNSSAHKYLEEVIEWTSRKKKIAEYEIYITPTNIVLEMLTPLTFRDQKKTGGNDHQGYISKLKINPDRNTITVEATLEPTDIDSVTECTIQETGSATDTITETGSATDTIEETGLC